MQSSPSIYFSEKTFDRLLEQFLSAGYEFRRLDEAPTTGAGTRICYLRHDVDMSPRSCLWAAKLAARKEIRSSCFFQLNAETYNAFDAYTLLVMKETRSLGHCVGLHIDQNLFGEDEERIARTIAWFRAVCCPVDQVVSFHRPTAAVLGREYSAFRSAYARDVFSPDRYASDSARNPAFAEKMRGWIRSGASPVQLLIHPEWWYPQEPAEGLWADLRKRRQWELEKYMVSNFGKVFGNLIQPNGCRFRV